MCGGDGRACVAGGHVWWGACMVREGGVQGCVWQGGMHGRGVCMAGGYAPPRYYDIR